MEHGRGFAACDVCHRHVRDTDTACPFCGAAVTAPAIAIARVPGAWPARAALLTGALVAGCTSGFSEPLYGGSPVEVTVNRAPDAGDGGDGGDGGEDDGDPSLLPADAGPDASAEDDAPFP